MAKAKYAENYALQITNTNQRLEECYLKLTDQIALMEGEKIHHLNQKVIVEQIRLIKDILKDSFDMEQRLKEDNQTNINIDVTRITQELKIIKTAIRETITELCPDVWPTFMEKLKDKLQAARIGIEEAQEDLEDIDGQVNINIKA